MGIKNLFVNAKALLHSADKLQKKAFFNVIRFFAIMLVLTFLARGTAGAALAKVTLTSAIAGTVTNQIEVDGKLEFSNNIKIVAPPGMQIEKLILKPGEALEQGQPIVQFDKKSTDLIIKTANAELNKLQVQYNSLQNNFSTDDLQLRTAQNNLEWAKNEKNSVISKNILSIDIATRKYNTALDRLNSSLANTTSLEDNTALQEEAERAHDELKLVEQAATELTAATQHAITQAELSLANAQNNFNALTKQTNQLKQSSLADAKLLLIDIDAKKEAIAAMQQIQKNEYFLLAPQSGHLTEWNITQGQPSTLVIGTISDASEGYIFTFPLTKQQSDLVNSDTKLSIIQGNNVINATISYITPQADDELFYAVVQIPSEKLQAGAAHASVTLFENNFPLCIPSTAVHHDNNGAFVYVAQEKNTLLGLSNIVARMDITVLKQSVETTAISSSYSEGKIITSASKAITVGDRVRINE